MTSSQRHRIHWSRYVAVSKIAADHLFDVVSGSEEELADIALRMARQHSRRSSERFAVDLLIILLIWNLQNREVSAVQKLQVLFDDRLGARSGLKGHSDPP